ncbi:unnamed protein product [Nyctereutes procyonoides]|uniref:(raccoon dog) hypothetical protein n=1 Tax=Nyctereutes procyonoides TaxID=34880 RepID=A0A811Z1W0_NYCPR|nr:unnamed protein product [Nyctereutes procyonoides]
MSRERLSSTPYHGTAATGVMDINTALQESLRQGQAHLCVLASNCDEPVYVKLVEALCAEHQINLIKDYGKESQAKDVIEEYFKCKKRIN